MSSAIVSPDYQIELPPDIREQLHIRPGQRLEYFIDGGQLRMVPVEPLVAMCGPMKGLDAAFERGQSERKSDDQESLASL